MVFAAKLLAEHPGKLLYAPTAMTYHQHRGFKDTLLKMEEYGEKTIPYLLDHYPQMYSDLVISRFVRLTDRREKFWSAKILMNYFGYLGARATRLVTPDFLSFRAIQYILAWHVLKGFRKSPRP